MATRGLKAFQNARARKQGKSSTKTAGETAVKTASAGDIFAQAMALHQAGQIGQARLLYQQILRVRPDHFNALHFLAVVEFQSGDYDSAEALFRRALAVNPGSAEAHSNFSLVYYSRGDYENAVAQCDRAIALKADFANALCNRGNALNSLKRHERALADADRALALKPDYPQALDVRACALFKLRRHDEALQAFGRALDLKPDYAEVYFNRATMLADMRRHDDALADFERSLAIKPGATDARLGYAKALLAKTRTAEAIAECEYALAAEPQSYEALTLLGQCHEAAADMHAAIACYDRALAIKPDFNGAIHNRIFAYDFVDEATFAEQQVARKYWWDQVGAKVAAAHPPQAFGNDRDPDRRIVLGYVSSDFRTHSAAYAFRPVLRHHDRAQFEVVCYSCSTQRDDITRDFEAMAGRWRDASDWSDDRLAEEIRNDRIDILIDLSGHSAGNRLEVFARKPAPVQFSAWGHGVGTGLPTIDHIFGDPVALPQEVRHHFVERFIDLPCIATIEPPPEVTAWPEPPLLTKGYVTYGVFNRINKISDQALAIWSRILETDPTARLVVKHQALSNTHVLRALMDRMIARGFTGDRITLMGFSKRAEHLAALREVDINLDTFPQNGGISTWESLCVGVPVLTTMGNSVASRLSGAILSSVGLTDWIAKGPDDYADLALGFGAKPDLLTALRRDLPGVVAHSEAGNNAAYTKAVDAAYRQAWKAYCAAGEP